MDWKKSLIERQGGRHVIRKFIGRQVITNQKDEDGLSFTLEKETKTFLRNDK